MQTMLPNSHKPQRFLFILLGAAGFLSNAASFAHAEDVSWPTYYPSPYGNYRQLAVTQRTSLGTANGAVITLATGTNSRVGIGTSIPNYAFEVRTPSTSAAATSGLYTARFINSTGAGVEVGSAGLVMGSAGVYIGYGNLQAVGGSQALILSAVAGGHVGIGSGSTNLSYALHVGGTGGIAFSRGGNTGQFKVAHSSGSFYPVYAPGSDSGFVPAVVGSTPSSCSGATPCGTYPGCYATSGCENTCGGGASYDGCGVCGGDGSSCGGGGGGAEVLEGSGCCLCPTGCFGGGGTCSADQVASYDQSQCPGDADCIAGYCFDGSGCSPC